MVPELLPEDERAVYESAPITAGTPAILERKLRELEVMSYRVHKWIHQGTPADPDPILDRPKFEQLANELNLLRRIVMASFKGLEVDARIKEADRITASEEAIMAYLATLPSAELTKVLTSGEMPRLDPVTGRPLDPKETIVEDPEIDDEEDDRG